MRAVVQRVSHAEVSVAGETVGKIEEGLMILLGVEKGDQQKDLEYIIKKTINLRVFEDENDVMNRSVLETGGSILAISQFTLLGDGRKGNRPSYFQAAEPEEANALYQAYVEACRAEGIHVETGIFRADMDVTLCNRGPVTILLDSRKTF